MRNIILSTLLLSGLMVSPALGDSTNLKFHNLENPTAYGEIKGRVINCTDQGNLENALVHIPGKSVATRLDQNGYFHLHLVPTGAHDLNLEMNYEDFGVVRKIPVNSGQLTDLEILQVCVKKASSETKRKPASASVGKSVHRCPKGGHVCLSSWHVRQARKAEQKAERVEARETNKPVTYVVSEGNKIVRIR